MLQSYLRPSTSSIVRENVKHVGHSKIVKSLEQFPYIHLYNLPKMKSPLGKGFNS